MKISYLDCINGISGDMFLGAMLDAGLERRCLDAMIRSLTISGVRLQIRKEMRKGIQGTRFIVHDRSPKKERHLKNIISLLKKARVKRGVFENAESIFEILALAESKVHGVSIDHIHFHEVGAVDSIVDILGACVAVDELGLQKIYASAVPLGSGFQKTEHGWWPMPGAATLEILKGIPVLQDGRLGELTTPTGAALVKYFVREFGNMPCANISSVGYGCGSRDDPDRPNVLRVIIGDMKEAKTADQVLLMETNIDDMNPQFISHVFDRLLDAGALDVYVTPIHMKGSRLGMTLSVMIKPEDRDPMSAIIFKETTSIGLRMKIMDRVKLERKIIQVMMGNKKIPVKVSYYDGKPVTMTPEFRNIQTLAMATGRSLKDLTIEAIRKAREFLS